MKKDPPIIVTCLRHPKQKIGGFFVLPKGRFIEAFWCKACKEWIIYDESSIKIHLTYLDDFATKPVDYIAEHRVRQGAPFLIGTVR